jgi:hypothetical protein
MGENKYSKWMMTISEAKGSKIPPQDVVEGMFRDISKKWCFQHEMVTTNHYQCCFTTDIRKRKSTLLKLIGEYIEEISMVTLEPMQGSWQQAMRYCTKTTSRMAAPRSSEVIYTRDDIKFLDVKEARYPWQDCLIRQLLDRSETLLVRAHPRKIYWITDELGNSGKSKFVKWFIDKFDHCVEITFAPAPQLRSALVNAGAKKCYFVDMTRTRGHEESLDSMLSVLESVKNGSLNTSYFGDYKSLLFDPPHVIVFSNEHCPMQKLSADRWQIYYIDQNKEFYGDYSFHFSPGQDPIS